MFLVPTRVWHIGDSSKIVVGQMTRDLLEWTLSREASALKFFLSVVQGQLTRARKSTVSSYTVILLREGTSPSGPGFVRVLLCQVADQGT